MVHVQGALVLHISGSELVREMCVCGEGIWVRVHLRSKGIRPCGKTLKRDIMNGALMLPRILLEPDPGLTAWVAILHAQCHILGSLVMPTEQINRHKNGMHQSPISVDMKYTLLWNTYTKGITINKIVQFHLSHQKIVSPPRLDTPSIVTMLQTQEGCVQSMPWRRVSV